MRRYETIVIVDPDISEEDRTTLITKTRETIPQQEGVFLQENHWGVKKLAYEIKKKPRGYYVLLDYCGTGKVVDEIERFFRIDDRVMKYLTVQIDQHADAEKILADLAAAKEKEGTPQEAAVSDEGQSGSEQQVAGSSGDKESQVAQNDQVNEPAPEN